MRSGVESGARREIAIVVELMCLMRRRVVHQPEEHNRIGSLLCDDRATLRVEILRAA
jgi:hypothetical protein